MAPPRGRGQRIADTRARLEGEVDAWVATASPTAGTPHLVPLSYLWDGESLLFATLTASRTARNLRGSARVQIALGPTRDVILLDGRAEEIPLDSLPAATADAFATRTGFDPRAEPEPYVFLRVRPVRIRAWREANELAGRDLMRDGRWLDDEA